MNEITLDSKIIGNAIHYYRKKCAVTKQILSERSNIGRTHLSAIEQGRRKPTLETLYKISTALDVKMSDILIMAEEELYL